MSDEDNRRVRVRPDAQQLCFDCGPLGEGNHGHFDSLSIELAAYGRSLIVDPGRYTYSEAGETNWRVWFRGTAAHNTVTVDGKNQTRYEPKSVAGPSRHTANTLRHRIAGPAAVAQMHCVEDHGGSAYLCGTVHSAEYDAVHTRHLLFAFGEYWLCVDQLRADTDHRYDLRFQLSEVAQDRASILRNGDTACVASPGLTIAFMDAPECEVALRAGFVSYEYGHKLAAPAACVRRTGRNTTFVTLLVPHRRDTLPVNIIATSASTFEVVIGEGCRALRDQLEITALPACGPTTWRAQRLGSQLADAV